MQSMFHMQWGLVGLSGLLAVALLANGSVLIGGIIGVMAVFRTVMLLRWHHHREAFRRRSSGNQPRG